MEFHEQIFNKQKIDIDRNRYVGCTFNDCDLMFTGEDTPQLRSNRFNRCKWHFGDAAARTILTLRGLYQTGFRPVVESVIRDIQENKGPDL